MKKFAAIALAIVLLFATATACAKTTYDPEKLCFVIVAKDGETGDTYVTEVTYKTAVKRVAAGLVYEIYVLESDALVKVEVETDEEGKPTFIQSITKEVITQ